MTDPVYEFIKGEGWVPSRGIHVTTLNGVKFRLELRAPVPGERVMQISHHHPVYTKRPDEVNMDRVINFFTTRNHGYNNFYKVPAHGYIHGHHTVVVVPL